MRRVLAVLVVVAVVAVAAWYFVLRPRRTNTPASTLQTIAVTRGALTSYVSAAGNVQSASSVDLPFQMAGQVSAVHVALGDQVQKGQLLAELDSTDLDLNVADAVQSLTVSEQQLAKAQIGATDAAVAAAGATLLSAQQNLAKVQAGPTQDELTAAETAVTAAQAKYNQLRAGPTADALASAQATLDKATIALQQAQVTYTDNAADPSSAQAALAAYQQAQLDYQVAKATYDTTTQPATTADLQAALSSVQQAQQSLDTLRQGPTEADISAAQAQVASAQSSLDALVAGPTTEDVAIAQSQVEQSRLALRKAQRAVDTSHLVAPFTGTVTALNITVGEYVGLADVALSITDLTALQVQAPVAEVDVAKVATGQQVQVSLSALSGVAIRGHVDHVGEVATISSGVVNYPVLIVLENPDPAARPGMTATMRIITSQVDSVLLIPLSAVKQNGPQSVVEVLQGDKTAMVPVQLGSNNGSAVEVTSGLQEGEKVVVGSGSTSSSSTTGGGGGGFFGVGGGGRTRSQAPQATP